MIDALASGQRNLSDGRCRHDGGRDAEGGLLGRPAHFMGGDEAALLDDEEIEPEHLDEETTEDSLTTIDGVSNLFLYVERRQREHHRRMATQRMPI